MVHTNSAPVPVPPYIQCHNGNQIVIGHLKTECWNIKFFKLQNENFNANLRRRRRDGPRLVQCGGTRKSQVGESGTKIFTSLQKCKWLEWELCKNVTSRSGSGHSVSLSQKYRIELLPTEWKPETILAFKWFIVFSFNRLALNNGSI